MTHRPPGSDVALYVLGPHLHEVRGQLLSQDDGRLRLALESPIGCGDAVCLRVGGDGAPWTWGRCERGGREVVLRVDGERRADRRDFHRVWGPLEVRYRPVTEGQLEGLGGRWLRGGEAARSGFVRAPPLVEFSGSGLRLALVDPRRTAGEPLLLGLRVPGAAREHRLLGRVVRNDPGAELLAVRFLRAPPEATLALLDFAERLMDAALDP